MGILAKRLAEYEKTWGALARWTLSIVFVVCLYALTHFADARYITRIEYAADKGSNAAALVEINGKLDSIIVDTTRNQQRILDIQHSLDGTAKASQPQTPGVASQQE
jgi:hypothetical protein